MKTLPLLLSLAMLLAVADVAPAQAPHSHKLGWLQGCWAMVNQERAVEEQWMAPRGKTIARQAVRKASAKHKSGRRTA